MKSNYPRTCSIVIAMLFLIFSAPVLRAQIYTGLGGPISDSLDTTYFQIMVSNLVPPNINGTFGLEEVMVDITHTKDRDIDMYLESPDGTIIELSTDNGDLGHNYTNTRFRWDGSAPITTGIAPLNGTWMPEGQLPQFNNGQNANGRWRLRIYDDNNTANNIGTLNAWHLKFSAAPAQALNFTSSDLPIVVINTNNVPIPDEPSIPALMQIIDYWPAQRNHLTDVPNIYDGNVNIEERGNFSSSLPQKPWNFETVDTAGLELDTSLLGMPSEHDWCLLACYNDKSFVRNLLASELFREMDHYAPRFRLCEVVLNGQYVGVYLLGERIKRDKKRVDVAKLDSTENVMPDISGGYITKIDYWDNINSWQLNYHPIDHQNLNIHMVYYYPDPAKITPQQQTYIQQFYNDMETALYSPNFADTATGYRKYLSIQSFLDYFIVNELARNVDGFKKSRFFHKEKDDSLGNIGKLKAGPVWDFDWAWNDIWDCSYFQQTDGSGWSYLINDCGPDVNSPGYYVRLLQDTLFANQLRCRWNDMRNYMLDTAYMFNYIDSIATRVNEAQQRHFLLFNNLGIVTGTPEISQAYSYAGEVDSLKQWILRRVNWLDANMPGNLVNCNNVGFAENALQPQHVSVFPNPFTSEFSVQLNLPVAQPVQVTITDMVGKAISETAYFSGTKGNNTFRIAAAPAPGIYFVTVKAGTQQVTRPLVRTE